VGFLPITTLVPAYVIFAGFAWAIALMLIRLYGKNLQALPSRSANPSAFSQHQPEPQRS
jgi:hypothetical protein